MDYNHYGDMPEVPDMKDLSQDDREDFAKKGCIIYLAALIIGLLICFFFGSCTATKYVPVIEHRTDTLRQTVMQRDSIHVHDSIHISEKGDTVRIERWHIQYRDRWRTDTVYQATHDTIPQPYPVEKLVEKPMSKTERGLMFTGLLSIMTLVVFVAVKLKKYLP